MIIENNCIKIRVNGQWTTFQCTFKQAHKILSELIKKTNKPSKFPCASPGCCFPTYVETKRFKRNKK